MRMIVPSGLVRGHKIIALYLSSGESSASFVGVVTWKDRPNPGVSETASDLCHEGNVEQVFSLAGWLSDPNVDPAYMYLATLVSITKKRTRPP